MRWWGWSPPGGINAFYGGQTSESSWFLSHMYTKNRSCEHTVWWHTPAIQERNDSEWNLPASTFILEFPASRTVRRKLLLFRPLSLRCFAVVVSRLRHGMIFMYTFWLRALSTSSCETWFLQYFVLRWLIEICILLLMVVTVIYDLPHRCTHQL